MLVQPHSFQGHIPVLASNSMIDCLQMTPSPRKPHSLLQLHSFPKCISLYFNQSLLTWSSCAPEICLYRIASAYVESSQPSINSFIQKPTSEDHYAHISRHSASDQLSQFNVKTVRTTQVRCSAGTSTFKRCRETSIRMHTYYSNSRSWRHHEPPEAKAP